MKQAAALCPVYLCQTDPLTNLQQKMSNYRCGPTFEQHEQSYFLQLLHNNIFFLYVKKVMSRKKQYRGSAANMVELM